MTRIWLVALVAVSGFGCHHAVVTTPSGPAEPTRWILDPDAHDWDTFCIPSPNQPGTDPSEAFPLRCISVEDVRRYVRSHRSANE